MPRVGVFRVALVLETFFKLFTAALADEFAAGPRSRQKGSLFTPLFADCGVVGAAVETFLVAFPSST